MRKTVIYNIKQVCNELDYDKLAEAIVKAQKSMAENQEKESKHKTDEYHAKIGWKDYSDINNKLIRYIKTKGNRIAVSRNILFAKKKVAQEMDASFLFIKSLTWYIVGLAQVIMYVLCALFSISLFCRPGILSGGLEIATCIFLALICFFFAQIFRLIKIDIDHIKDREYMFVIFGALCTVIPGIIWLVNQIQSINH